MPGGGAEIFAHEVRQKICPEKITGDRWLEVTEQVHHAGLKTNATMLYGHVESPEDRVEHMARLRELQDELINELVKLTTPGIPYFIQIVMNHVVALYRKNPQFSIEDLRKTYDVEITGFEGRRLFDTFERHFKRYGSRQLGATALLRKLSNSGDEGIEKTKLEKAYRVSSDLRGRSEFDIILRYLEYDFYIEKVTGTNRYRFASPILRDYWQKNQR